MHAVMGRRALTSAEGAQTLGWAVIRENRVTVLLGGVADLVVVLLSRLQAVQYYLPPSRAAVCVSAVTPAHAST